MRIDVEHIAWCPRSEADLLAEERPQARRVHLECVARVGRCRLGPERLGEAVDRDDPAGAEQERGQKPPLLGRHADGDAIAPYPEWPYESERDRDPLDLSS